MDITALLVYNSSLPDNKSSEGVARTLKNKGIEVIKQGSAVSTILSVPFVDLVIFIMNEPAMFFEEVCREALQNKITVMVCDDVLALYKEEATNNFLGEFSRDKRIIKTRLLTISRDLGDYLRSKKEIEFIRERNKKAENRKKRLGLIDLFGSSPENTTSD